jgi:NAD(P)-dependent dehydrogenase (short-subunit alcohol dehydrogenase family)
MRLRDKVILVTGASTGIGKALAIGCAQEGADVIVAYHSDRAGGEDTTAQIEKLGRRSVAIQVDLGNVSEIDALFVQAKAHFSKLDVLINNAAVTGWSEIFNTTEEKWDQVLGANLKGNFFTTLAAARWMRKNKTAGSIVNVTTNCAELGVKNLIAYATSKSGLNGMVKQLAVELAPYDIRVNAYGPGPTNVARNLEDDPNYRTTWGSVVPLGRTADVEEMIGPALFLASEDSKYMTGQVFYVDGGWSIQGRLPEGYFDSAADKNV